MDRRFATLVFGIYILGGISIKKANLCSWPGLLVLDRLA